MLCLLHLLDSRAWILRLSTLVRSVPSLCSVLLRVLALSLVLVSLSTTGRLLICRCNLATSWRLRRRNDS